MQSWILNFSLKSQRLIEDMASVAYSVNLEEQWRTWLDQDISFLVNNRFHTTRTMNMQISGQLAPDALYPPPPPKKNKNK